MKSHFLSALIAKDIFLINELNEVNDLQNILKILQNIKVNNFTEIFLNSKKKSAGISRIVLCTCLCC